MKESLTKYEDSKEDTFLVDGESVNLTSSGTEVNHVEEVLLNGFHEQVKSDRGSMMTRLHDIKEDTFLVDGESVDLSPLETQDKCTEEVF